MKLRKGSLYHVKWHDTITIENWCNLDTIVEKAKEVAYNQETVGWFVVEKCDYYVFSATLNNSQGMLPYSNIVMIPKGCVKKIISL